MTEDTTALYADYGKWKGWSAPFVCDADQAAYFAAELRGRDLKRADVLEIGFGNGEFLGWARAQGANITGSELTPAAIASAEAAGIALLPADFERRSADAIRFDLIAAFDVFEHLDGPAIVAKLTAIATMLRPGGWLILRYPNGQSPFGLFAQHGDATHISALSRAKIEQYAAGTGLVTLRYGGVARPASGAISRRIIRMARHALRDLHAACLRFLYATDVEMEPVVTHILAKPVPDA